MGEERKGCLIGVRFCLIELGWRWGCGWADLIAGDRNIVDDDGSGADEDDCNGVDNDSEV